MMAAPAERVKKANKDAIEMDGIVTESLPNAMFRVELEANKMVSWPPSVCILQGEIIWAGMADFACT
jgi:hypothetical protein